MRVVRVAIMAMVALVVASACYQPRLPECQITCADDGFCPGELTCAAGNRCGATATSCGDVSDAAPDDGGDSPDAPVGSAVWAVLSVGSFHACAIDVDGALWCWGNNDLRQLGRSSPLRSGTPLRVDEAGPADWASVSAGERHSCAIRGDGTLWCWGINDDRQCGQATGNFVAPTAVPDPAGLTGTRWAAVTTGAFFTCGLRDDGTLWCFGSSVEGQLGQGSQAQTSAAPLRVGTGADWRSINAGLYHVCGIHGPVGAGALSCWGADPGDGRIGDGGTTSRFAPTPVDDDGQDWRAVAVGDYSACAIDAIGALYCWGERYHVPGNPVVTVPTRYQRLTELTGLDVGGFGGCFVRAGALSCWGTNDEGALGQVIPDGEIDPVPVPGLGTVLTVGTGNGFTCSLDGGGVIECWGDSSDGQLGDGVLSDQRSPVEVMGNHHPWRRVEIGADHVCAVNDGGELYCWGNNTASQLGDPAITDPLRSTPVQVDDTLTWLDVGAGARHSCGTTAAGAYCWGANDDGQRGVGDASPSAQPMMIDTVPVQALSVGDHASCSVRISDGARRCWGDNEHTNLGNNSSTGQVAPPADYTIGAAAWTRVAMGVHGGCGISAATILYCWGENGAGEAARDPTVDNPVIIPVQVPDPTTSIDDHWIDIAVGEDHACGVISELGSAGALFCWGYNGSGQLGSAAAGSHALRQVGTAFDWIAVAVGTAHTCGVRSNGVMDCFGYNGSGQLGDDTAANHLAGVAPVAGTPDWVAVAAGARVTCGIRGADRRLFCWGQNDHGQLGNGQSVRWVPAAVLRP